jgi:methylmalonyl-CoA/ethylmalonyl-CoA epimerase
MANNKPAESIFSNLCDIGIVVKDIDKAVKRLEALGIGPFKQAPTPPGAEGLFYLGKPLVSNYKALVARLGKVKIELFQPGDASDPFKTFMKTQGEGIHHLGFQVNNVEKEINKLTKQGAEVIYTARISGRIAAAFLDLKAGNILIELTDI